MSKQEYIDKVNANIDQWKSKANELKAKAKEVETDQKIKFERHAEQIDAHVQNLQDKLVELQRSGEQNWQNVKLRVDQKIDEIRNLI